MRISGEYRDIDNNTWRVFISTNTDNDLVYVIGDDNIYFSPNPITISSSADELTDHIIKHTAKITLLLPNYMGDKLFTGGARDIKVNITKNNECIFAGYQTSNTYNQKYNDIYDSFDLNCIDYLSTLQYYKYKNVKTEQQYNQALEESDVKTYKEILNGILQHNPNLINTAYTSKIYYDQSKSTEEGVKENIFEKIGVSDLLFLDDDYDSVWKQDEVVEELLKFLNLHIEQIGYDFYIYDWDSLKG